MLKTSRKPFKISKKFKFEKSRENTVKYNKKDKKCQKKAKKPTKIFKNQEKTVKYIEKTLKISKNRKNHQKY